MKIDELGSFIYRFNKYKCLCDVHETTHIRKSKDATCYAIYRFVGFSNEREDEMFFLLVEIAENNFYFTKENDANKIALKSLRRK